MALPTRRSYAGAADICTLSSLISAGATTAILTGSLVNWPSVGTGPFYIVIDPGLTVEEKVLVTGVSGQTLTISRGQDNTQAAQHSAGATCYPVGAAVDFDEANSALSTMTTKGDLLVTTGSAYARLPVGTNTYALLADSTAANGVAWGQIAAGGIATGAVTSAKILDDTIVNADINSAAAIAYSKLNLATSIVNADVSTSAAIALSKLATTGTVTATTFVGALTGTASGNLVSGGALGTPSSGTLTNCTFPTLNQSTTGNAATATTLTGMVRGTATGTSNGIGVATITHGLGSVPSQIFYSTQTTATSGQNYIASSPAPTSTQFTIYNMAGSTAYTVYFMVFA